MAVSKRVQLLERAVYRPSIIIAVIGMVTIVPMMLLTAGDAVLRNLFDYPILGAHELNEFMMVILVFSALGYTAIEKGHVAVDLVAERLPKRAQAFFDIVTGILSLAVFCLVTWQSTVYGVEVSQKGILSATLEIPIFPFVFASALGSGLLCLAILLNLVKSINQWNKK